MYIEKNTKTTLINILLFKTKLLLPKIPYNIHLFILHPYILFILTTSLKTLTQLFLLQLSINYIKNITQPQTLNLLSFSFYFISKNR